MLGSEDNANIWMDKWIEDTLLKPSLEEQAWLASRGDESSIPTVGANVAIEKGDLVRGFSHEKWWIFP